MLTQFTRILVISAAVAFALLACCPSVGRATSFTPETSSGTVNLIASPVQSGGASVISGADRFTVGGSGFLLGVTNTDRSLTWFNLATLFVGVTHAGRSYFTCDSIPHYPCADSVDFTLRMVAPGPPPAPPLTPADYHLTVPGTFDLDVGAFVQFADPSQNFGFGPFGRSGPADITLQWVGFWDFESGFAEFGPTPEPTTLLLWGTTAAGLGLVARWRRHLKGRRKEPEGAA